MSGDLFFVYGTLRNGERNCGVMRSGPPARKARPIGEGAISGFRLIDLGSFPGAIRQDGGKIRGELWYCPAENYDGLLELLDSLEGNGWHYNRIRVDVTLDSGEVFQAWFYELMEDRPHRPRVDGDTYPRSGGGPRVG